MLARCGTVAGVLAQSWTVGGKRMGVARVTEESPDEDAVPSHRPSSPGSMPPSARKGMRRVDRAPTAHVARAGESDYQE